jgi:hypothetical protein
MLSVPGEVICQLGWVGVQETVFVRNLDRRPDLKLATHLAISDGGSNLVHELRNDLGILVASLVFRVLDPIGYVSQLVFESFQGARENSVCGTQQRGTEKANVSRAPPRAGCSLWTASPSFAPKPSLSKLFTKTPNSSLVTDDSL